MVVRHTVPAAPHMRCSGTASATRRVSVKPPPYGPVPGRHWAPSRRDQRWPSCRQRLGGARRFQPPIFANPVARRLEHGGGAVPRHRSDEAAAIEALHQPICAYRRRHLVRRPARRHRLPPYIFFLPRPRYKFRNRNRSGHEGVVAGLVHLWQPRRRPRAEAVERDGFGDRRIGHPSEHAPLQPPQPVP